MPLDSSSFAVAKKTTICAGVFKVGRLSSRLVSTLSQVERVYAIAVDLSTFSQVERVSLHALQVASICTPNTLRGRQFMHNLPTIPPPQLRSRMHACLMFALPRKNRAHIGHTLIDRVYILALCTLPYFLSSE